MRAHGHAFIVYDSADAKLPSVFLFVLFFFAAVLLVLIGPTIPQRQCVGDRSANNYAKCIIMQNKRFILALPVCPTSMNLSRPRRRKHGQEWIGDSLGRTFIHFYLPAQRRSAVRAVSHLPISASDKCVAAAPVAT